MTVAAVVWNGVDGVPPENPAEPAPAFVVPRLDRWPTGADGLRAWAAALQSAGKRKAESGNGRKKDSAGGKTPDQAKTSARDDFRRVLRPLTIVAGKGGVGKTSVACALALSTADGATLLVSTDPAPSLADALAQAIPDADTPVERERGLFARQMDATAAFARMRDEYSARVDALFDGIMGRGLDLAADRAIVRDLLALAPPGVDEIYALSLVADALFEERYATVIVDPAPTGHLLRMLEMPSLALAWTHQLMRLMLKYKDVAGLGDTARELLEFSKRLRALDAVLTDGDRAGVVIVTLSEPVVQSETVRLSEAVRARGVAVTGVVLNRADDAAALLPVTQAPVQLHAPTVFPPPVGVNAIRQWASKWREA